MTSSGEAVVSGVSSRSRIEKAAHDNGFDLPRLAADPWISFASSKCDLVVWLATTIEFSTLLAVSRSDVAIALNVGTEVVLDELPQGAAAAKRVSDAATLHHALRRAFQLAVSLPDGPLAEFQAATARLPRSTEAERLAVQRVGQDLFRASLMEYWEGRCAVTGLAVPRLLRASHAKPWADCESDEERLDVFNGFLLAPNLDACFDAGLITFSSDGRLLIARSVEKDARLLLGLADGVFIRRLQPRHERYLSWHRSRVFVERLVR